MHPEAGFGRCLEKSVNICKQLNGCLAHNNTSSSAYDTKKVSMMLSYVAWESNALLFAK
jgi:hypothetical protein